MAAGGRQFVLNNIASEPLTFRLDEEKKKEMCNKKVKKKRIKRLFTALVSSVCVGLIKTPLMTSLGESWEI